ncbi:hypothetical protein MTO96_007483 [Rhipicephalus appendiculatus]
MKGWILADRAVHALEIDPSGKRKAKSLKQKLRAATGVREETQKDGKRQNISLSEGCVGGGSVGKDAKEVEEEETQTDAPCYDHDDGTYTNHREGG